jgi:hypothetical protein
MPRDKRTGRFRFTASEKLFLTDTMHMLLWQDDRSGWGVSETILMALRLIEQERNAKHKSAADAAR